MRRFPCPIWKSRKSQPKCPIWHRLPLQHPSRKMNSFRTSFRHHSANEQKLPDCCWKPTWTVPHKRTGHGKPVGDPRSDHGSCPLRRNGTPPRTNSSSGQIVFRHRRLVHRRRRRHSTGRPRPRQVTHGITTMYINLVVVITIIVAVITGTGKERWDRKLARSDRRGIPARCRCCPRRRSARLRPGWIRIGPVRGRKRASRGRQVRSEEGRNR